MRRSPLSMRQLDVLALVALGYRNKEIAVRLGIRYETVREVLSRIYIALDTPDRAAAVAVALRTGLMQ